MIASYTPYNYMIASLQAHILTYVAEYVHHRYDHEIKACIGTG